MSNRRSREARAIMAETGMNYTKALLEAGRRHVEAQASGHPPIPVGTPRFASGGTIAPLAGDSDSVPALLERGCAYIIVRDENGQS